MDDITSAAVFYENAKAGIVRKIPGGYEFEYDSNYLRDPQAAPISLIMPLRQEKYESSALFPFFSGLLPEGWLLNLTCSTLKIDANDKFKLLLHTGEDTIGAVRVKPLDANQ